MPERVPVHLLDPEGGAEGQVPVIEGGIFVVGDAPGGGTGGDGDLFGEPVASIDLDGQPDLVFDEDGGLVWAEAL